MQNSHPVDASSEASPAQTDLRAQLATDENVLCTVVVDLNRQLRFSRGWLALTDLRLMAQDPETGQWTSWPLPGKAPAGAAPALTLHHFDHAGVGTLELHGDGSRLASWRFTLAADVQVLRLIRLFEQQTAPGPDVAGPPDEVALCPLCDTVLPPDSE
ncbi:MAG: ABC transporter, partial [Polaromonas sp.]|nr:ABC transporter [Polaromonas sp.]